MIETRKAHLRASLITCMEGWLGEDENQIGAYAGNELARTMADAGIAVLEANCNLEEYLAENDLLKTE